MDGLYWRIPLKWMRTGGVYYLACIFCGSKVPSLRITRRFKHIRQYTAIPGDGHRNASRSKHVFFTFALW